MTEPSGYEIAKKALEEARAKNRRRPAAPGKPQLDDAPRNKARRRWSGAGPDHRDPQSLGALVGRLSQAPGWKGRVGAATVFNTWDSIVGPDVSAHAQPNRLDDTILYVTAESTAWATQLRYVQSQIIAKIAAAVGDGVVTQLKITGPQAPSWRKGPRHVPGRGPRDTYG
ncbi:MAG: DciA family protein [Gordonia sp. (in: high G+C Gram-positive bacteria)]|uniref:DciA family protein n=1 Tax=Gordonia sp. (in: high G+C Gram-positive bacteria) TaxID=84139 RepID=UPI0039E37474